MPNISSKAVTMPESPIRKLVPYAEKAKSSGKSVFHLNIGQPDIETPEAALKAIKNIDRTVIEYSHSAGFQSYRERLSNYYKNVGIDVEYDNILVTTGGSEALTFGFMSTCDPNDEVIIPEPFYANYNGFAMASGVEVVPVLSTIETGFALPPMEEFEKLITSKTKAILICNPGNPTGYMYSREELLKLKDIVLKHDLFLIADEVYREFAYDGAKHLSILSLGGLENHAIIIDSVSKRYSMCGARIGALVSKNKDVMSTAMKFAQARLSPPTFAQIASEAALDTPDSYFDEVNEEYRERRDIMVDGLNSIPGVICPKPRGAFYAVAELPVDDADSFARWLLETYDYNGETVMLAPASGFYTNPMLGKKQARVAYVLNKEALLASIEILRHALEAYHGKTN